MQTFLYRTATFQRRHHQMFMKCNKRTNTVTNIPLGDVMLARYNGTVNAMLSGVPSVVFTLCVCLKSVSECRQKKKSFSPFKYDYIDNIDDYYYFVLQTSPAANLVEVCFQMSLCTTFTSLTNRRFVKIYIKRQATSFCDFLHCNIAKNH